MKSILLAFLCASLYAQNSAIYPNGIATNSDVLVAGNRQQAYLSSAITSSTLSIGVVGGSPFTAPMVITIDSEIIKICSKSSTVLSVCSGGRGYDGTTAAPHASQAPVRGNIVAWHHNQLAAEIKAVEALLGVNGANLISLSLTGSPFILASIYNFSQTPGGSVSVGANTVTMIPCPLGVNGTDVGHYYYLTDGTGTAETVLGTGGTCTSGTISGTLTFTAANTHSGAWTIRSASGGLQENVVFVGYYGGLILGCQTYEIYAPIRVSYRVSIDGCGIDSTYLHNNSATTGVINYTALTPPGDQDTFGGVRFAGFTIYSGALSNAATNTSVSDAIYLLGAGWNVEIDVFIRNHTTGIHQVNGWYSKITGGGCRFFRDYCAYTETDGDLGAGTQAGAGNGGSQQITDFKVSNVGATGPQTSTGCAIRYANWSGFDLKGVDVTATQWGLCLQPRAAHGAETFTAVYYGTVSNSFFDTTANGGILLDSTAATAGSVSSVDFNGIKTAYNGFVSGAFANAACGVDIRAVSPNPVRAITFNGGETRENGGHGVCTSANAFVQYLNFHGFTADNNSQLTTNTYDGYHFGAGNFEVIMNGVRSGKINSILPNRQRYGFWGDTALTQFNVVGNTFLPAPSNASGPCLLNSSSLLNNFSRNLPYDSACNGTPDLSTYITTETGTNNAIAGSASVALIYGPCVNIQLAHSLQAGANTFNYNGGGAVNIKSSRNTTNNIATAYAATGRVNLCYNTAGAVWMDMAQ